MAGSVDNINLCILPETACGGGGNGDPAVLFLGHPVHGGLAVIDLADPVTLSCVVQDSFRGSRFSRVYVGDYSYVAHVLHSIYVSPGLQITLVKEILTYWPCVGKES